MKHKYSIKTSLHVGVVNAQVLISSVDGFLSLYRMA